MPPPDLAAILAHYNRINHYGQANGVVLAVPAPGQAEYRTAVRGEHLSSLGSMLAGLMDAALGAAARSLAFITGEQVANGEFKLNYLRPCCWATSCAPSSSRVRWPVATRQQRYHLPPFGW